MIKKRKYDAVDIEKFGSEALSIAELAEANPKGSNVKIML